MTRKFVLIGGSGLIGKKLAINLRGRGHEVTSASPSSGVNTITKQGLAEALAGAGVVVDVSNSPSFEDKAVLDFFETSTRNILAAAKQAGVGHYVALSVVGTDRLPDNGYFRAKLVQENLIKAGTIPYSIVRATQFFEFMGAIAQSAAGDGAIRLSSAAMQPIAADDVALALTEVAAGTPLNRTVELAGPEKLPLVEFVERAMRANGDGRAVIADPRAPYYGAMLDDYSLTPGDASPLLGKVTFADWLARSAK
jgi:uncharacterized protein YbjT (DUF2867 family)